MDREYRGLKRAYGEMSFCWQETMAEEWQKGRLRHEEKEKKIRIDIGGGAYAAVRAVYGPPGGGGTDDRRFGRAGSGGVGSGGRAFGNSGRDGGGAGEVFGNL